METWAPLFSNIVGSSLWDEPDYVVKIFLTMLAIKDSDHVVRGNAYKIGKLARKTEKDVLDAWKVLSSPDTKRIEAQPFDGRRIQKTEDGSGWMILNGQKYEDLMREVNRRVYKARKQREYRAAEKPRGPMAGERTFEKAVGEGASGEQLDKMTDVR